MTATIVPLAWPEVGAGHAHTLYHHGHSRVHRLAPETKVAAAFAFVFAVAVTPRRALWAFGLHALALVVVIAAARLPVRFVLARLLIILPFVAFAFLIPFVSGGESVRVLGLSLSREGLWGTANILSKATLGATASIVLAGTTEQARILDGLARLRVPRTFTTIAAFMLRYLELLADEVTRMRRAMVARGYAPRWISQAAPMANAAGALFIRSYERGERVHGAMVARGFTGEMPTFGAEPARPADWAFAAVLPVTAMIVAAAAVVWS